MPHIFLYGPPGTGKSTIGKELAGSLGLPFLDLDQAIETQAGISIPQIVQGQGEPAFRDLESLTLRALANDEESIIALGGGALLREENRLLAESSGTVILLVAEFDTLLERLQEDPRGRPLLAGDLPSRLTDLLKGREAHYNSFPIKLSVDGKTAQQSALEIQASLGRHHLTGMGEYDVLIWDHGIQQLGPTLKSRGLQDPLVVTDDNVAKLHLEPALASLRLSGFEPKAAIIPAGEAHKDLATVSELWKSFLENGLDRRSTVVALGGGVTGDLAGFAASTFMRGIRWVAVPTTLLSMVDASLGGKTGFDLPEGKNLVGSFHAPALVLADPQLLRTLPQAELISGLAEVVKHGIISDPELFHLCAAGLEPVKARLEEVVKRAMAVKIRIIEEDPFENGVRAQLNLGHTVGHAVELVSEFQLRHGEAVAIGMVAEAGLAERMGVAGTGLSKAVGESLSALGLPTCIPPELPREKLLHAMRLDKKKKAGIVRFALPVEIGKVELVEMSDLEMVLEE